MESVQNPGMNIIPTVNFHFIDKCNYRCPFCYANYPANRKKEELNHEQKINIIGQIAKHGAFKKINFAGGEPFLYERLLELVRYAKSHGLQTSIVTNFSRLSPQVLKEYVGHLDLLGLSVDSTNPETLRTHGRYEDAVSGQIEEKLTEIANFCRQNGILIKVNTVVTQANRHEILSPIVSKIGAFRWKIFQINIIKGLMSNKAHLLKVTEKELEEYVRNNRPYIENSQIDIIIETEHLMRKSYLMVNPYGEFEYRDDDNKFCKSSKIWEVGIEAALREVRADYERFLARHGDYRLPVRDS